MKSIFKIVFFFFFSISLFVGCKSTKVVTKSAEQAKDATTPKNESSLLWKVEGNGIKPSYVFGTMHILKTEDFNIKEPVKKAFNQADQLVLEVDMDDPEMQLTIMQHVSMKDGMTLDQLVEKEIYNQLDDKLTKSMGVGIAMFKTWQPLMLSTLLLKDIVGSQPASFEGSLIEMAKKQEIEVLGLETVEEQVGFFHDIPYKDQAEMIKEYVTEADEVAKGFAQLTKHYLSEDIDEMHRFLEKEAKGQLSTTEIIDKRNQNWIPKIKKMATHKSTFFGVGAGHLGGSKGVINLLKKAGYKLTAIN